MRLLMRIGPWYGGFSSSCVGWGLLLAPITIPVIKKFNAENPLWLQLYIEIASLASILVAAWLMLRFIDRNHFYLSDSHPATRSATARSD